MASRANKGREKVISLPLLLAPWVPLLSSRAQTTHTVFIEGMQFKPPSVIVRLGDSIVWKNTDLVPHTATASDRAFDSGLIQAGATWSLHMEARGEILYTCAIHPLMKGKIAVK